jgi:hypothetical protein
MRVTWPAISSSLNLSFGKSTSYEALHYEIFSRIVLFHPPSLEIFSSALCTQIPASPCSSLNVRDQVCCGNVFTEADRVQQFLLLLRVFVAAGTCLLSYLGIESFYRGDTQTYRLQDNFISLLFFQN